MRQAICGRKITQDSKGLRIQRSLDIDAKASDRCLIYVDPRVFAIWKGAFASFCYMWSAFLHVFIQPNSMLQLNITMTSREPHTVWNHQQLGCLLNSLFRLTSSQTSALLAFVRGIHPWRVDSPHKGLVTPKASSICDFKDWPYCIYL